MMHRKAATLIAAAVSLVAGGASADEPAPSFGRKGTLVFGDVVAARAMTAAPVGFVGVVPPFSAGWLSFGSVYTGNTTMRYARLDPAVDVFVADGASLGIRLGAAVGRFDGDSGRNEVWNVTAVPRLGYAFDLADGIAVWPRIAAGVTVDEPNQTRTGTVFRSALDVPFVFRLSRNVVFDVGPEIAYVDHLSGPIDFKGITGGGRGALSLVF
jgi:hypothetical protein